MLEALDLSDGAEAPDLRPLADVPSLSYREGDHHVRTPDRDRIADLDAIPSPILTGIFDPYAPAHASQTIPLERHRGCPYGCTFCDWSSATLSRIRKFDLNRVFAELRSTYGNLQVVHGNYGKNTTKHLAKIINCLSEAEIITEGKISLQTWDSHTPT